MNRRRTEACGRVVERDVRLEDASGGIKGSCSAVEVASAFRRWRRRWGSSGCAGAVEEGMDEGIIDIEGEELNKPSPLDIIAVSPLAFCSCGRDRI